MGLFDKFKKPVLLEAVPDDLDFMSAIEAHVRWKVRLETYINGESKEQLDAAVVGRDDMCVLGKWIHGPGGTKYGDLPLFQGLRETHAGFHQCAAQVIQSVDQGDRDKAVEILPAAAMPSTPTRRKPSWPASPWKSVRCRNKSNYWRWLLAPHAARHHLVFEQTALQRSVE